jgi:hypothetical protein
MAHTTARSKAPARARRVQLGAVGIYAARPAPPHGEDGSQDDETDSEEYCVCLDEQLWMGMGGDSPAAFKDHAQVGTLPQEQL